MILINEPKSSETANTFVNLTSVDDEFIDMQATRGHRSQAGDENFDDFTNMFKGYRRRRSDLDEFTAAKLVVRKVKRERNPSRLNDAVIWCEREAYFSTSSECCSDIED